jgi:hypothetical protein
MKREIHILRKERKLKVSEKKKNSGKYLDGGELTRVEIT